MSTEPFNPLAMESLAEAIVQRLMLNAPVSLGSLQRFNGAGLYAIYYTGDFPAYNLVRDRNINDQWELPIYVGKAVPKGGRQGVGVSTASNTAVWSRLNQHATSIRAAQNLDIDDFFARWLIVDDIWIALGESALIRDTRPVWNASVDGFGNHDPGAGRANGLAPQWDTVHPGRPWAARLRQRPVTEGPVILAGAQEYLRSRHGS